MDRRTTHTHNGKPVYDNQDVEFDWDALDGELSGMTPEQQSRYFITSVIDWLLSFLLYGDKGKVKNLETGFKRLLALCYVVKPSVLDGDTLEDITTELGQSRNALTRWTSELSYMFQMKGANQMAFKSRLTFALTQLKVWNDEERKDLPTDFESFIQQHQELLNRTTEAEAEAETLRAQVDRLKGQLKKTPPANL